MVESRRLSAVSGETAYYKYYKEIIQDCVVWVEGRGTGFFISSDLVLTCTHVLEGQEKVSLRPFGVEKPLLAVALPGGLPADHGDLTLLRVIDPPLDQPAVLLHVLNRRDLTEDREVTLAGFPQDNLSQPGGYEPSDTTVHPRWLAANTLDTLIIDTSADVPPGLSGSPVLDLRTGTVIGVTRYRKGGMNDPGGGGGAIPIAVAVQSFPAVRALYQQPPQAASVWLSRRTAEQLQAIGREPNGTTGQLDLRLSGTLDEWRVTVDNAEDSSPEVVRLDALGVNVTRAVFQWARGRRTSSSEDLQLVGEILSKALLGGQVKNYYDQWREAARELSIRLIADPSCELADLPWEYARLPSGSSASLGTDAHLAIARVMPGTGTDRLLAAGDGSVEVLAIAVQPDPTTYPSLNVHGELIPWPTVAELQTTIRDLIADPLQLRGVLCNPTRKMLTNHEGACDVLHYQGFAQVTSAGTSLALFDDTTKKLAWVSIDRIADIVRGLKASVVVIEAHAAPASEFSLDDPARRIAAPLLRAGAMAVLTTRFAVHPSQARLFNTDFYAALAAGATVERAAQEGRTKVDFDDTLGDQTTFGAFVLWTGETAGLRLVAVADQPEEQAGPQQFSRPLSASALIGRPAPADLVPGPAVQTQRPQGDSSAVRI